MCDYSLHNVTSRPAKVRERLVSTRFNGSMTRGFASIGEPTVAVCLLPGTEVAFEKEVEFDNPLGFLPRQKLETKVARFRRVNKDQPSAHHDALEFADGQILLVTQLCEGQEVTVLQLPAELRTAEKAKISELTPSSSNR